VFSVALNDTPLLLQKGGLYHRLPASGRHQNSNHKTSKYGFETLSEFLLFDLPYLLFTALLDCSSVLILQEKRTVVWHIKQYIS